MDTSEGKSAATRNALALFLLSATACGLVVVAAKTAPLQSAAITGANTATTAAAGLYAARPPEQPLLASQVTSLQGQVQSMHEDLASIHFEFIRLQETLDLMVGDIMADLKRENEELRDEVHRMYLRLGQSRMDPANIPAPEPAAPAPAPTDATASFFKDGQFSFVVLEEWGRSPEDAARLGNNVSTLKGIIGLVPPNSGANDLQSLGINLRTQYADYDNINIEVFDNKEAADGFSKRQVANPLHRVLSVSKHANSGRDVILLVQNGITTEVPY